MLRLRRFFSLEMLSLLMGIVLFMPSTAEAVVGQAEGFDEFEEERLEEFHQALIDEEKLSAMTIDQDYVEELKEKQEELTEVENPEEEEVLAEEIEMLKRQLLEVPEIDRFKIELNGDYTYDSNISRQVPRSEKGDSVFNALATTVIDLSGRKTDLRTDFSFRRQWNIIFSEKDTWQAEQRLRFRRKFFKKLDVSMSSRGARHNSKTIEIDDNKIRYDFNNQLAFNYPLAKKISVNSSYGSVKRYFPQEAFDQDSGWQVTANPSAFWSVTPKSRISMGYSFGASRTRVKSGDTNSHAINLGYFGQITRKSSTSLTLAYARQVPRSTDTARSRTVTAGVGLIYQVTPKTQATLQYTRAIQNTTSELASGEVDGENSTTKTDTHFVNENLALSLNSRVMQKLTAIMTASAIHTRTVTFVDADKDSEARTFSFPLSVALTYAVRKWMTLNFSYRFNFRTGNEKADTTRAHTWFSSLRLTY